MNQKDIDPYLHNQTLKTEFTLRGLDLAEVWQPTPDNLELENRQLEHLLDWVIKYQECPDRKKLEAEGYLFPPTYPGIDPDTDWLIFERWMQGMPVRAKMKDQLQGGFLFREPESMTDEEIEAELERFFTHLADSHFSIDLVEDLPPRLVYILLREVLKEEFEFIAAGRWHINGCGGYCPRCVQRPWCEAGGNLCWPEDEEAGHMVLPEETRRYVSPSPVSLEILRCNQEEEEKDFSSFSDDLPF
ncbi:MAG: hypothetical protein ACE5NG_21425 [bacterium]